MNSFWNLEKLDDLNVSCNYFIYIFISMKPVIESKMWNLNWLVIIQWKKRHVIFFMSTCSFVLQLVVFKIQTEVEYAINYRCNMVQACALG